MASRKEQKEQARAARVAQEQAAAAAQVRRQRFTMLGGIVAVAVVVVAVIVVISSSGSSTAAAKPQSSAGVAAAKRVDALLAGIPQESDDVLGSSTAPVTITEYGDLECSICDEFALATTSTASNGSSGTGIEDQIIDDLVKTGKAKLVYDALDTATSNGVTPNMFDTQQAAAYAAGLQDKAWYYIELFYNEQGAEGTDYVTQSYLDGLAKQVPGLDYGKWLTDLHGPSLTQQVSTDDSAGTKVDVEEGAGGASTPTVVVSGPKGTSGLDPGIPTYAAVEQAVKAVE